MNRVGQTCGIGPSQGFGGKIVIPALLSDLLLNSRHCCRRGTNDSERSGNNRRNGPTTALSSSILRFLYRPRRTFPCLPSTFPDSPTFEPSSLLLRPVEVTAVSCEDAAPRSDDSGREDEVRGRAGGTVAPAICFMGGIGTTRTKR
jgi:hypothetical protein